MDPKKPGEAAPQRKWARQVRGDLETIIFTAMHRDPGRRYSSAEHLAEDIRRFLDRQTVAARPDTLAYRAQKFAARNKFPVAAFALGLILLGALAARDYVDRVRGSAASRTCARSPISSFRTSTEPWLTGLRPAPARALQQSSSVSGRTLRRNRW